MATAGLSLQKGMERFLLIMMTLVFAVSLASLAAAQDEDLEDVDLIGFSFETSSDSWIEGERGYNLRNGQYVTMEGMKSDSGDIIKMKEFSPFWVIIEIAGKNILFSTDEEYDGRVDAKALRVANSVAIHYDGTYVAAFGNRAYTIDLLEGGYDLLESYAEFVYYRGGTASRKDIVKKESKSPTPARRVTKQIQTLDVVITMPDPKASLFSESDLTVEFIGPSHFLAHYLAISADRKERTFTFHHISPGTYNVEATWGGLSISKSVVIRGKTAKVELTLE